jgi:hypothetical protein
MHATSQYGLLFMAILDALTVRVQKQGSNHRLSVVVESGHENAPDTARLFKERQAIYEARGIDFLQTHTLASKKQSPFLMVSDMIAHGFAMQNREIKGGKNIDWKDRKSPGEPGPGQTGWTVLEVSPGYLNILIEQFTDERLARHDDYLKRKAAWLASQAEGK